MKYMMMAIAAMLLFGCKKEEVSKNVNNELAGTWELQKFDGGWSAEIIYEVGNGNTITFTTDGHFTKTTKETGADNVESLVTTSGEYTLSNASSCSGRTTDQIITFSNDNRQQVVTIVDNQLTLNDGQCIADGSSETYIRK